MLAIQGANQRAGSRSRAAGPKGALMRPGTPPCASRPSMRDELLLELRHRTVHFKRGLSCGDSGAGNRT
eukprot:7871989-Alexandrium_andersonii.AAC.1